MNSAEYIKKALRTEPKLEFTKTKYIDERLEHAFIGICSEAGEIADLLKKVKIYKKNIEKIEILEEASDLLWYIAIICDYYKVSFEELMEMNIKKLNKRFPESFSSKARDKVNKAKEYSEMNKVIN
ncbi:MAG: nucleoside triphosphate pyrophosphohydrolase family protein [Candidatus Dojkabacteria bacterium]|nr:nucleoside triphosphate pyrophosphohydrolase family protein [Candidatus Dojkabacteria bacterium]MDQ7020852.1 nucleoside triphosphate pyrophosphohydrolase family protein [Candidatus Dojkabacteria bacterium]